MSESSRLTIDGEVDSFKFDSSGNSRFEGIDYEVKNTEIRLSGYSLAKREVLEKLDIYARGGSNIS